MNKKIEINLSEPEFKIGLKNNIVSVGSCFADEISSFLKKKSVIILSNPFGTIYNVHSILRTLEIIFGGRSFGKDDLVFENGKYMSLDHTTEFDSQDPEAVLEKINDRMSVCRDAFAVSDTFIITPGTSAVYRYEKNGKIAANCHKLPGGLFTKRMLTVEENVKILRTIVDLINENTKVAKIIFTLSPIRHNPSDLVENSLSKSILRTAISLVVNGSNTVYFPSYEIILDELRDYSFYGRDGIHLRKKAVKIVAEKFINLYFEKDFLAFIKEYDHCRRNLGHRPFAPHSSDHMKFLKDTLVKLCSLHGLNGSQIIERDIIKIVLRIIRYSGNEISLDSLQDGQFKRFLKMLACCVNDAPFEIDDGAIGYENASYKKIEDLKRRIYAKYHHNKGDFGKSSGILNLWKK
jgi:hypothetical protein